METSTLPKKFSMADYFKCRYHLTLFRMGLLGLLTYGRPKSPLQKICFRYQIRLKFSIVLSYLKKIQKTCKHVVHPPTPLEFC